MVVRKERQFLCFYLDDGSVVKYDFAQRRCIGKSGRVVNQLNGQLKGITITDVISSCEDVNYGRFLEFLQRSHYGGGISNIGSILKEVNNFANYEQLFSAGIGLQIIKDANNRFFKYSINEIPKALIKLLKEYPEIKLDNYFLDFFKQHQDNTLSAYNQEYISLTKEDITLILKSGYSQNYYSSTSPRIFYVNLFLDFGYTIKGLMNYMDYLKTFEGLDDMLWNIREIYDYARLMNMLSLKFDKYPRHFLTTHKIASRNYNRMKQYYDEKQFEKRIDKRLERTFGEYRFYYPESTQAIKDEAASMNNCVASYIDKVIKGECHILFLRYKEKPDESLVTIELRNNRIVQALQKYNHPLTAEQREVVDRYNKWLENKAKGQNESEDE